MTSRRSNGSDRRAPKAGADRGVHRTDDVPAPKVRDQSEDTVKDHVHDWYKGLGGFSFAVVQNGFGVHGIPDRVGCIPVTITQAMVGRTIGVFAAIESKKTKRRKEKGGGLSTMQVEKAREIISANGFWSVAYHSTDLVEIDRIFWEVYLGRQKPVP